MKFSNYIYPDLKQESIVIDSGVLRLFTCKNDEYYLDNEAQYYDGVIERFYGWFLTNIYEVKSSIKFIVN